MRDQWLRDVLIRSTSESEQINPTKGLLLTGKSSIDEEGAVRLLSDCGIAEDRAKVQLQVIENKYTNECLYSSLFFKEIQTRKSDDVRGYFSTEELVNVLKKLSTRPEIYHLLVRYIDSINKNIFLDFFLFRYSRNHDFLSTDDLILFLEAEQGVR